MRTSSLLISSLLLSGLLATRATVAQSVLQNGVWRPGRPGLPLGYYNQAAMQRTPTPPPLVTVAQPEPEPAAIPQAEPDTSTQRLFARHRVRAIIRLLLDDEGRVRDTVGYQEIDPQGRRTLATTTSADSPHRRQWSYNAQGQCVSRIEAPSRRWPFTTLQHFNPTTQHSLRKALLPNGSSPLLRETMVYHHGDTTLTQSLHHALTINGQPYSQDLLRRTFTYSPHPDTTLTVQYDFSLKGAPLQMQTQYALRRQGHATEQGLLVLRKPSAEGAVALRQALEQLRQNQEQGRVATERNFYDRYRRLVRQELLIPANGPALATTKIIRFTYNSQHQLIGRVESTQAGTTSLRPFYTVYSYAPSGLLQGETTNQQRSAATFYRYQYEYYE